MQRTGGKAGKNGTRKACKYWLSDFPRTLFDTMEVGPEFSEKYNMLVLNLLEAKPVKVKTDLNYFALPTWQFEEEMQIMAEEDEESEDK